MPATLALQQEFADSLQVLFVAPAGSRAELEAFGAERGWFETEAMWTHEAPLQPSTRYPWFALLSPEGRVLLEGSASAQQQAIRDSLGGSA